MQVSLISLVKNDGLREGVLPRLHPRPTASEYLLALGGGPPPRHPFLVRSFFTNLLIMFRRWADGARQDYDSGFSLIEMLVYIGLLAVIGTTLTLFAGRLLNRNTHAQLQAEALTNARQVADAVSYEIRQATAVYDPTSVFDTHPGQLSLVTDVTPPADEDITYLDLYIDDEKLYRKREGQAPELLVAENVRITNFVLALIQASSKQPAVRLQLTVAPQLTSGQAASATSASLTTAVSLRAY